VVRAIDRGQWQAPLGSSRGQPPIAAEPAAVLASVNDKRFGGAEEASALTAVARDGDASRGREEYLRCASNKRME
jgi:hypothetical protein